MLNEKAYALGANRSVIRDLFEYGLSRAAIVGAEISTITPWATPPSPRPRK